MPEYSVSVDCFPGTYMYQLLSTQTGNSTYPKLNTRYACSYFTDQQEQNTFLKFQIGNDGVYVAIEIGTGSTFAPLAQSYPAFGQVFSISIPGTTYNIVVHPTLG